MCRWCSPATAGSAPSFPPPPAPHPTTGGSRAVSRRRRSRMASPPASRGRCRQRERSTTKTCRNTAARQRGRTPAALRKSTRPAGSERAPPARGCPSCLVYLPPPPSNIWCRWCLAAGRASPPIWGNRTRPQVRSRHQQALPPARYCSGTLRHLGSACRLLPGWSD